MHFTRGSPHKRETEMRRNDVPSMGRGRSRVVPKRTGVRLPNPMLQEVDRIVGEHPEMSYTRQQFIESAVREKLERLIMLSREQVNKAHR